MPPEPETIPPVAALRRASVRLEQRTLMLPAVDVATLRRVALEAGISERSSWSYADLVRFAVADLASKLRGEHAAQTLEAASRYRLQLAGGSQLPAVLDNLEALGEARQLEDPSLRAALAEADASVDRAEAPPVESMPLGRGPDPVPLAESKPRPKPRPRPKAKAKARPRPRPRPRPKRRTGRS